MTTLKTDRLELRPLGPQDAAEITRLISDWDVIQWLTSPPWPYALADAERFLGDAASDGTFAITKDGIFMGAVGGPNDLGYWLGREFWGKGYMTEAARAVVAHFFATGTRTLTSGYILGNNASNGVLTKLGFMNTQVENTFAVPHGKEMPVQRMVLDAARWRERCRDV